MKERTLARLVNAPEVANRKFFRAFIDYDMFIFAIAADLRAVSQNRPELIRSSRDQNLIEDVYQTAMKALKERTSAGEHGNQFLFDRGLWSDNPVAAYAKCRDKEQPKKECRWSGYVSDISHAQRWPMWLQSFHAASTDSHTRKTIQLWRSNLARQIADQVISFDGEGRPIMTNFMDGMDGWYIFPGSENSPPSSMTGWAMRYGAWSVLAPLEPRIGRAQKAFCMTILSDRKSDLRFRTSYYGHPQSNPVLGTLQATDDFGIFSDYAKPCWLYHVMGFY